MSKNRQISFFVVGLALFSMFFGSGNLIFPLFLGQVAGGEWIFASIGFFTTAVLLPLVGIAAMVLYKGDYPAFFQSLGKRTGLLAIFALLVVWIPLGSGPRCVALAYASLLPYLDTAPTLWISNALYCLAVFIVVYKKSRLLDVLGYVLTPVLLVCLALIIFKGIDLYALAPAPITENSFSMFIRGLTEGYNTMDLIASFFFSASVIEILRLSSSDEKHVLSQTFKASLVGASLLAIVYIGLICLATSHVGQLHDIPKEQLLVHIAKDLLGSQLGMIASIAVFLACFTTSVALATVFADFLAEKVFGNAKYYILALGLTQSVTFGMSIIGLKGITAITEPILQVYYPILMILIVVNVGKKYLLPQPTVPVQQLN